MVSMLFRYIVYVFENFIDYKKENLGLQFASDQTNYDAIQQNKR